MWDPWAPGWDAVTAIATALLFVATVALVYTAWVTISRNTAALGTQTEAVRVQNRLLELETTPVLVVELAARSEVDHIGHWTLITGRKVGDATKLTLEGYLSSDQVYANSEFAAVRGQPQNRAWEIVRITNAGRSPAVRGKLRVKLIWGTSRIDPTVEGGTAHEQHLDDGVFDLPACAAGGAYRIGVINQSGVVVRLHSSFDPSTHKPTVQMTEEQVPVVVPIPITIQPAT